VNGTETPPVAPAALPADPNSPQETRDQAAAARAAAAAAAKERQQQVQQEVREFIDWLERGYNGTSDTEDFLSRQMSKHLQGDKGENFSPARLIRARETLDCYGFEEGLKRLATSDPEIADRIRREPPRPRGIRDIPSRRRE